MEKKKKSSGQSSSMQNRLMPVDSLSYSAFTQLLRNPMIFKLKYVLGVYNGKTTVSGMIGRAGHEAFAAYYGGKGEIELPIDPIARRAMAYEIGLDYLNMANDEYIEYGKTGSREEMLKGYAQAMNLYWAEEPEYHEVLACEQLLTAEMHTLDGDMLPLPASGRPDLVVKAKNGDVEIFDHKFVRSFTNYNTEDYTKIVQAMFMYHIVAESFNVTPTRMVFREIKRTVNKDGSPQIQDWVVPFEHRPYFVMFYNLYKDVVRYLANDPIFLPNFSDVFDGEHAGLMYCQGLISADMSDVEVMHKVRDVARVSKKFVSSNLDRAENKDLPIPEKIKVRLSEFGIPVEPVDTIDGAQIIQYRFNVSRGVRMSSIHKHKDDIVRTLETKGEVRILTPVPGTSFVGIEVEKDVRQEARLQRSHFIPRSMELPIGIDVSGELLRASLTDMPHLLIAGATGSGKSVMLSTLIRSITAQMSHKELELVLIDPKRVEFAQYGSIEHLHGRQVITDPSNATSALIALVSLMDSRYDLLQQAGAKDIVSYNARRKKKMLYEVCVIDEFADLIMRDRSREKGGGYGAKSKTWLIGEVISRKAEGSVDLFGASKQELVEYLECLDAKDPLTRSTANVEYLITRLAQMGRAAGIHLIIATQNPRVDVITGLIKANFPTRIAFRTASPTDSMVILGEAGAEKLSGKGDMIFMGHAIKGGKIRLQGLIYDETDN